MSSTSDTAPPSMTSFDSISDSEAAWVLSSPPTTGQKSEHPSRVPTPGLNLHDEPVKHPRFYYKDGSLSFCFEDAVFRVHGSIFASLSPFWAEKLDYVETLKVEQRDLAVSVSSSELSSFLCVLYPKTFGEPELSTLEEWTAVLRLSSIWKFESIRQLAIKQLDGRVPPLERLVLSRSYGIPGWLPGAFVDIILRESPLSVEEMMRLGSSLQDLAHITTGREDVLCRRVPANKLALRDYVLKHIIKSSIPSELDSPPSYAGQSTAPSSNAAESSTTRTIMTPQTLPSTRPSEVDTHFSFDESQALKTALSKYDYDAAIQFARPDTVPAFCEAIALVVDDLDWLSNYEKLTFSIVGLVVSDASSQQTALRMLKFLSGLAEPRKGLYRKLKALIKSTVEELRDTWSHVEVNGDVTDLSVTRLRFFDGHTKAFRVMGPRDFLLAFPRVYIQRSQNLKPFVAALVDAKLVD